MRAIGAELVAEIEALKAKIRRIPFIDPIDIRFRRFETVPKPVAQAVMFCLMDVSGSMTEHMKDLAKRFYMLLYVFLKRRYRHVEIVFIRHTDRAEEVDEQTFFYGPASGGTLVYATSPLRSLSLGYNLTHREILDYGFGDDLQPIDYLPLLNLADSASVGSLGSIVNRSALTLDGSWGVLDQFEESMRKRKTSVLPLTPMTEHAQYPRFYGEAVQMIDVAECALLQSDNDYMEWCRRAAEDGIEFGPELDRRLQLRKQYCAKLAYDAVGIMMRVNSMVRSAFPGTEKKPGASTPTIAGV